jgi:hypothetical protein
MRFVEASNLLRFNYSSKVIYMSWNSSKVLDPWSWIVAMSTLAFLTSSSLATERRPHTLYIAPVPSGTQDGSDWDNAGSLEMLPKFIARAGAGGKVLLKADDGPYQFSRPIIISSGGNREAPVTIAGVDRISQPMRAEIIGTRADPWSYDGIPGPEGFRLSDGANYLTFEQISFRNQGNGCFRIAGDIKGIVIRDVDARNVQRFVENHPSGLREAASIDGLSIRRVVVRGYSKGVVRLKSNSQNIEIEDVTGDSERQDRDNFAIGVSLDGTVHNVVLRRVTMMNNQDTTHEYWNGDGFATERGVYNVRFEDTFASGSTDAGYDLKSSQTDLLRARAEDNKRNFRIWGEATITDCVSRNPHKRGGTGSQNHFWVAKRAKVHIKGCRVEDMDSATVAFEIAPQGEGIVQNSLIKISPEARLSAPQDGGSLSITAE